MQSDSKTRNLAAVTAAVVTTAAFAKVFVPFYLIGSTPIFAAFVSLGFILAIFNWRQLWETARHIPHLLPVGMGLLYALVIISYLLNSRSEVPLTHLLGILIFHTIFLAFGIMASRAPQAILWTLLSAGAIYLIVIVQHTLRFGDLMRNGYLNDLFGIGDVAIFQAFHQNIGIVLGLATLAGFGLTSNRMKQILAIVVLLLILLFFYHIGARGGLLALVCSLAFLVSGRLWMHSRKKALLIALAVILSVAFVSAILYQRALQYKSVDQVSPDVISRTMREIQDTNPDLRRQIWVRAWHRITSEPGHLLFGQGIGMFPVHEGAGAPDWLLRKTEGSKHYPHNVYLEVLYETGIVGLILFGFITLYPLIASLHRWQLFDSAERTAISMYVFVLVTTQVSGAFAYSYDLQFFLALAVGIVAIKRTEARQYRSVANSTPESA